MTKYLLKRLLTGVLSACAATIIVMIMIFSLLDRNLVFAKDSVYSHQTNNAREAYKYRKWREYGYLDYVTYADYVNSLVRNGEVGEETAKTAVKLGRTAEKDCCLFPLCLELSHSNEACGPAPQITGNPYSIQYTWTSEQSGRSKYGTDGCV